MPAPVVSELVAGGVVPLLRGRLGQPYLFVRSCPSTQRLLPEDAPEGAIAITEEQTSGRGRLGRSWEAPAGTSLLFSLQLRPAVEPVRLPTLMPAAAEACGTAIAHVGGVAATVKHPNDVLVEGRKVAGVLAEALADRVVLGVGVNVNQVEQELPPRPRLPATSLRLAAGRRIDRVELLVELLAALEREYDLWLARSV